MPGIGSGRPFWSADQLASRKGESPCGGFPNSKGVAPGRPEPPWRYAFVIVHEVVRRVWPPSTSSRRRTRPLGGHADQLLGLFQGRRAADGHPARGRNGLVDVAVKRRRTYATRRAPRKSALLASAPSALMSTGEIRGPVQNKHLRN